MENGTFHQRTLHGAERVLHPCQKNVGAPDLIGCQVVAVRLQHVAAIQFDGNGLFLKFLLPEKSPAPSVIFDPVIARHTRISLPESANRLLDLLCFLQPSFLHPHLQSLKIHHQAPFLLQPDGSVFLLPTLTETENVDLVSFLPAFDLYP